MKWRLVASIYLLSSGKCWIKKCIPISSRSTFTGLDRRQGLIDCSFQARGLNRFLHSSALQDDSLSELDREEPECSNKKISEKLDNFVDEEPSSNLDPGIVECSSKKIKFVTKKHDAFPDDDFSELGPGISESSAKKIKLVTEKLDSFLGDDFSELGPGISESSIKQIKLVTEKRDRVTKAQSHGRAKSSIAVSSDQKLDINNLFKGFNAFRTSSTTPHAPPVHESISTDHKESASSALYSDCTPTAKELLAATTKASTTSPTKLQSRVQMPISTDDDIEVSEIESPLSVSIKNIPSKVGLSELIEAISVYGKVSGASFVTISDKIKCCNVEFEDADSCRKAILAGKVEVGDDIFQVNPLDAVDLVAVQIKNINQKSADSAIHSICKSVGELVGLTRTSKHVAEAFFYVRNHTSHRDIVKKLHKRVLDMNQWSASVVTSISNSSGDREGMREELHLQIFRQSSELRKELQLKRIHLQDLEYLNESIIHLQCTATAPPPQSGIR